jgi:hypothetical protein
VACGHAHRCAANNSGWKCATPSRIPAL